MKSPTLLGIAAGFVILALLFGALEGLFPARVQRRLRAGFLTDLGYWFFTPLVTRVITQAAVVMVFVAIALKLGAPLEKSAVKTTLENYRTPLTGWPQWAQAIAVLFAGDLIGYWGHRMFHRVPLLWPFHAVHHGSKELDWLSSVRLHPVNDVLMRLAQVIPLFLLGFKPLLLAVYVPFLTFHALFIHANVPWTFGPLKYLVSSPAFHRWHHTSEAEGLDKNFAGLFPWIDLVFGTFYMPPGRQPEKFGIAGTQVPQGLWRQLAYPFSRAGK
jgi:sterol desaturase/sphingolipid hydroxylase (fatty acid hydroxylase superfamily)